MSKVAETLPAYWDELIVKKKEDLRLDAWRQYMKSVYLSLTEKWFDPETSSVLKTDLFEEACTQHSLLPRWQKNGIGMDYSLKIAGYAKQKLNAQKIECSIVVCDLRSLPFLPSSLHQILSPSSLDHFSDSEEIDVALKEIARVLKPGGVLILTLDNPSNPMVWLRNRLPYSWLNRIGLLPYYTGATCSFEEAKKKLQQAGLQVIDSTAVVHVPRVFAIWAVMLAEALRNERLTSWLPKHFEKWESLRKWPVRFRTGYYCAFKAVKCLS